MAAVSRYVDPGAYGKIFHGAFNNAATAAVNGAAIQRVASGDTYLGAILHLKVGAATGSPTGQSVVAKLQTSADGSTNWTDITGAATAAITADNGVAQVSVNLGGALTYIRAVVTPTLTGGTTPNIPVIATVFLAGDSEIP
jgi:hypothetical protein